MSLVMDTSVEALLLAYHRDGDEEARDRARWVEKRPDHTGGP
jgi:hypothetical protein